MSVTTSGRRGTPWLFFMFQLPARRASQRVSVWRRLQKYGALAWKNSAYVLPHSASNLEKFQWLSSEIRKFRGEASVVEVARIGGYSAKQIISLFSEARSRDYDALIRDIRFALRPLTSRGRRRSGAMARLNRRLSEIAAVDFFGCPRRKEAEALVKELEARSQRATPGNGEQEMRKLEEFRGRVWMTRPRPEVDRVGSAWLIKHFIDPEARFVFSSEPRAHPGAVRYDMFEGEFTHIGDNCTFETLLERFDLRDKRLRLIAQIVHDADLEDNKFGRAGGRALDLIFKGWGKMGWPDKEILRKGFGIYDGLYMTVGS